MSNNDEIERLGKKFNEIIEFFKNCESRLSESERIEYEKNYSKVETTLSCIESESNKIKFVNTRIRNITKEFYKHEGWLILFGVIGYFLFFIFNTITEDRFSIICLIGIYYLIKVNGLNREINDEKSDINSSQTSIKIFKRDLKLYGVEFHSIDNLIEYRSKDSDLYLNEESVKTDEYHEYRKNKYGNSIVISDYQIRLSVLRFTLDSLGSNYDDEKMKTLLYSSYLTSYY
ncbi:hypothetical protein DPM18_08090 [Polynucleobacter paneuropaeus]|uniref:hypothetical protein n=1 Tax=Polynucleobacter paneuropaeus TaxID=2527775 RepID=UPI000DBF2A19|nr:hypothetical protein [Polynucleobacter paneuropaeus]AWW46771.1 hypothetical protein DPM18_08090 [Polynucleobacter paneuropaeus]